MPQCQHCQIDKPKSEFYELRGAKIGRKKVCKSCIAVAGRQWRSTLSYKLKQAWVGMNRRPKEQPEYAGVEVRMDRATFMAWATERFIKWMAEHPGETPTIDRIVTPGHYEIGNIQILSKSENSIKANLPKTRRGKGPAGTAWCCRCQQYLPEAKFNKNRTTVNGLQAYCLVCRAADRPKKTNPNWKNQYAPAGHSWCNKCLAFLPVDKFYTCNHGPTGLQTRCKACQSETARLRVKKRKILLVRGV